MILKTNRLIFRKLTYELMILILIASDKSEYDALRREGSLSI